MTPAQTESIKIGDSVTFNASARYWTRGRTFVITSVRPWGVICEWNNAPYRAGWDKIATVNGVQVSV